MLRTIPITRANSFWGRLASIALFTVLMIVSSRVSIETGNPEVPFTMQVLVVLLSGMVLGARDGMLAQIAYVSLIASGLPFDTRGLGSVALFGPTGGFLMGFIAAATVTGFLVERAGKRLWQRWIAGLVGVVVIYLFGASHLLLYTGMSVERAWQVGVAPFWALDMVKALIAAGLVETTRTLMNRSS
jgi:biotin transport system substrate-specific component